jgi:SAM-dependent methyltransferase
MNLGPTLSSLLRLPADYVDMHLMWQRRLLTRAAPLAHGRLLDVGCGNMPYRHVFLPHVLEYVGIEYSRTFERTDASNRSYVPDLYDDGVRLPFDDASFNSILNVDVLEHTPEPARLVKEMGRVLKDGGTLILTAPFSFRLQATWRS